MLFGLPSAEAAIDEASLLDRYRPTLRYDSDEEYFAQPVSLPPSRPAVRDGNRVHGRVANEGGEKWLQYWLFYAYNPQDRTPLRTGRHEGDWELIQFRLGRDHRPDLATMSQHSWAEGCGWSELEHGAGGDRNGPILYVANGSHATYSRPGSYDRPFPDPTDEADGEGAEVRPAMTTVTPRKPDWVRYRGRWGDSEAGVVPGEQSSPLGPRFQDSHAWSRPGSYHDDEARGCGSGAPSRPWQTAATIGAGAVLVLVAIALVRRRRFRRGLTPR